MIQICTVLPDQLLRKKVPCNKDLTCVKKEEDCLVLKGRDGNGEL